MVKAGLLVRASGVVALLMSAATAAAQDFKWVASQGAVPANAIIGGEEPARKLPVCRGRYGEGGNVGIHPGKLVAGKCNIGWGGREIGLRQFEVLTGDPRAVRWVPAALGMLPPGAFIGGEEPGRRLAVCRARYGQGSNVGVHPGKLVAGKCNIGWGGREIALSSFQVMLAAATPPSSAHDVTSHVETLGTPLQSKYPSGEKVYARNPWAMEAFNGRIYIGSGNSNNDPPAKNAGPAEIWAYDIAGRRFVKEWTAPDEQIDVFRVIGGALVVPGHDPTQNWAKGNFYRRMASGSWETVRTIANGIHNYDMIGFGGRIFAGLGVVPGAAVAVSGDGGRNWGYDVIRTAPWGRVRSFFVAGGTLHASTLGKTLTNKTRGKVYALKSGKFKEVDRDFFPGDGREDLFVVRPVSFRSQAVYLGASPQVDHDWAPRGLYGAQSNGSVRRLVLPGNAQARDLKVDGNTLYALAWRAGLVAVYATGDLSSWREVLAFRAATFARSFAIAGGDFYFGLGCEPHGLHGETGRILRVKAANVPK